MWFFLYEMLKKVLKRHLRYSQSKINLTETQALAIPHFLRVSAITCDEPTLCRTRQTEESFYQPFLSHCLSTGTMDLLQWAWICTSALKIAITLSEKALSGRERCCSTCPEPNLAIIPDSSTSLPSLPADEHFSVCNQCEPNLPRLYKNI